MDIYYFDESGFNLSPNLPYAWNTIGETLSIPSKMSKKLNVLGFLDINNSKLFASTTYDRVDTAVVIEVFNLFVEQMTKDTIVVVDNAPTHTSKKFKEQIKVWEEKGLRVFFLPPYSPQLNPIEQLWKFMKYYWIELDAYKSVEMMKNYVEKVIVGYGKEYEINFDQLLKSGTLFDKSKYKKDIHQKTPNKWTKKPNNFNVYLDTKLVKVCRDGSYSNYSKHISEYTDYELMQYYQNYDIDNENYTKYLATRNIMIDKGLLSKEKINLHNFNEDEFLAFKE